MRQQTEIFLWVLFWGEVFSVVVGFLSLALRENYPRTVEYSRGLDAFRVFIAVWMVWFFWWLLHP